MEEIREGVIVKTSKGEYLVIAINKADAQESNNEFLLMEIHGFTVEGSYKNADEISKRHNVLDVVLATVEESLIS